MNIIYKAGIFLIFWLTSSTVFAEADFVARRNVDFIHYKAELAADFKALSVSGKVQIEFVAKVENVEQLTFSAKYKTIYSVKINNVTTANLIEDERLIVTFKDPLQVNKTYLLTVEYQALPERGMKFYDDHLFTVYHTKNWLVSHDSIADKASFELLLTHDAKLTSVGNGRLLSTGAKFGNKVISHWKHTNGCYDDLSYYLL